MPITKVNGINFYYEVHGSGKPLTIINGLSADISESGNVSEGFAKNHKVLIFDNRGAGRSDKPDEPYSIEQMASDTAGVMKEAGFNKSDVIGISMGGRIALDLTLSKPNMINKLVLVSTSARVKPNWFRFLATRYPHFFKSKYPQPKYAFVRQRVASGSYDCYSRLGEIQAPTLIAHGENDKLAPMDLAYEMQEGIKGSVLQKFKGGHLFFLFRSRQQFTEAVNEFLK
jgi:3-oxoadipate enol-lactonase